MNGALINRRRLLKNIFVLGVVAPLPLTISALPIAAGEPTEWDLFLARVQGEVEGLVRREGRGLKELWIEPPRVEGSHFVRKVHIFLNPGPSLLDRLHFEVTLFSGSRWNGDDV